MTSPLELERAPTSSIVLVYTPDQDTAESELGASHHRQTKKQDESTSETLCISQSFLENDETVAITEKIAQDVTAKLAWS